MNIPFVKGHGARNDFLLTWRKDIPAAAGSSADLAIAICERNVGVGADGWIILDPAPGADAGIELWNSDGSRSEISGNGTRCAAALLLAEGHASGPEVTIVTGAGPKSIRVIERTGYKFSFQMNMGSATIEDLHATVVPGRDAVILNVGNPQLAIFVDDFDFDWRTLGAQMERHPFFPNRTNVSFVKRIDAHTIDVRFFERGAGETMSSGTGSTGAAAAVIARGFAQSPVRVLTPAGPLDLEQQGANLLLNGPAEIVARGEFVYDR